MANNELKTRIALCSKTEAEWSSDQTVILKGELAISSDKRKIKIGNGVSTWTQLTYVNLTPEEANDLITQASHTHDNKLILDATTASFTVELLTKLNGIETGANKTVVDTELDSNSTNPVQNKIIKQALDQKVSNTRKINGHALSTDVTLDAEDVGAIPASQKGVAGGVAELDSSGKVPSSQLPSYVDDVIEGYFYNNKMYKDAAYTSEITGETGKIYTDLSTEKTYRWSGSAWVVISDTIALGETSSTAYRGDRGKIAYDHSQATHAPSNAEKNVIVTVKKNGTTLTPAADRSVDIIVPTKVSELTNDKNYLTNTGTAASATKLANSRNFSISGAVTAAAVSFNGENNVVLNATAVDAAKLYLNTGDTLILNGSF